MREVGIIGSHICGRPVYEDGLCHRHYKKEQAKRVPFGKREGYREATRKDILSGRTLYLKTMPSYGGHQFRKGMFMTGDRIPKTQPAFDPTLFVVKDEH